MNTAIDTRLRQRPMSLDDLDAVMAIENRIYPHPWTRGNFSDSLAAGYHCRVAQIVGEIVGYSVVMIALDEAHLLNLAVAAQWQRRGLGRELLNTLLERAHELRVRKVYLEVRPSNVAGRALYGSAGFTEIGTRRGYYPSERSREDAVVMELALAS
jgi:[ribosomal protein S18]-alanine N-acetyltransferase